METLALNQPIRLSTAEPLVVVKEEEYKRLLEAEERLEQVLRDQKELPGDVVELRAELRESYDAIMELGMSLREFIQFYGAFKDRDHQQPADMITKYAIDALKKDAAVHAKLRARRTELNLPTDEEEAKMKRQRAYDIEKNVE